MLDNFTATHLYRIAQEAVNNAIKHGKAQRIEMSLTGENEDVRLKVLDNGIGIGDERGSGPGMGLRIMDYRAGLIGAAVQVAPSSDGGTLVSCKVYRGGSLQ
jgi:signal transduction histidine kinase